MPTVRTSRNVARETKRRREDSPVVAVAAAAAPLEENQPKKKDRRGRSWEESYDALVDYKKQHGNCKVPFLNKEDRALGKWVSNQRSSNRYCPKKLTPEKKDRLTQLEFDWETLEEKQERQWNEFFQRLKVYRMMYLDCCVSQGSKLGTWVANQRALDKRGALPSHRKEKLESVKFTLSINASPPERDHSKQDEKWFAQYNVLVEFHKDHGHCLVPNNYKKDKSLGKWVARQRTTNKEGSMRPDRFQPLEDIGFVWEVDCADPKASLTKRQWDEMYQVSTPRRV
jgi:hypothetical protein